MINNTQVDDAQDFDVVMPTCSLIKYSDVYLKKSRCLWQYYLDKPAFDTSNNIIEFPANNGSILFRFKWKLPERKGNDGTKVVQIIYY